MKRNKTHRKKQKFRKRETEDNNSNIKKKKRERERKENKQTRTQDKKKYIKRVEKESWPRRSSLIVKLCRSRRRRCGGAVVGGSGALHDQVRFAFQIGEGPAHLTVCHATSIFSHNIFVVVVLLSSSSFFFFLCFFFQLLLENFFPLVY